MTDLFNNEERVLINSICKNEKLSSLAKQDVLNTLLFSRQIADEGDSMMIDLLDGIIKKIQGLTDGEWDELKMNVPFPVAMVAEDEVSEVPSDED